MQRPGVGRRNANRQGRGSVGVCSCGGGGLEGGAGVSRQKRNLRNWESLPVILHVSRLAGPQPSRPLRGKDAENPLYHRASLFPHAWPGMFFPLDLGESWLGV